MIPTLTSAQGMLTASSSFRGRLRKAAVLIWVIPLLFSSISVFAQTPVLITGSVKAANGELLQGVTVTLKNSEVSATTGTDGRYSITVPNARGTLVISYVGYATQEVNVNNRAVVNVTLELAESDLNEVVVVGYGTVQRRELTSAVTTIRAKDFVPGPVNSPLQLIDGKAAGVTVSAPAAADPNANPSIQVRGASSIIAGNDPLYIIDGMPGGNIRNLAQQDIESITVLKDASAASIYGSRGANGVVLIQTKKGRSGAATVTYDSYVEHDEVYAKPEILTAAEFIERGRDADRGANVNWYNELLNKDNFGQNHFVSVSGGSDKTVFRLSGNYRTKSGIDIASDRKEYGLRASFQQKALNDLLEITGNLSYRVANEEYTNYGAFKQAVKLNPTIPIMDPNNPDRYNFLQGYDTYNPVQDLLTRENGADNTYSIIDINTKLNLTRNLSTQLKMATQRTDQLRREYYNADAPESISNNRRGRGRLQDTRWTDYTLEWTGNYDQRFGKHSINAVGGYSYQEFNQQNFFAENADFASDGFSYNNLGNGLWNQEEGRLGMGSDKSKEKTIAFLGRVNYGFDDTYFLTGSLRYEGNTKFGANNKWGLFPSLSAAWRLSNMGFLQNSNVVNDLKVRFSYGSAGRSNFDRYTSLSRYSGYGRYQNNEGQWIQVFGPGNNYNPDLKWERAIAYNLGIDFGFFNNRLSGSIDVFDRQNKDLISNYNVPVGPFPLSEMTVNVGSTSAKGIELSLNWDAVRSENFNYSTSIVGSYIKARLKSWSNDTYKSQFRYFGDLPSPGNPGPAYRLEDGVEIGSYYGYKYAGVDDMGQILIWKDGVVGKEAIIASSEGNADRDRVYLGNGAPRVELAWNNSFSFRNFDLSLYFRGRFDYQIINLYQMYFGLQAEPGVNLLKDAYTRNGHITSGKVITDYFLEPGDYFRLDNITLGWSPSIHSFIKNLRVYGTVRNVFTVTKYSGLDPMQVGVTGLTPGFGSLDVYPIARTFSLGLQVTL